MVLCADRRHEKDGHDLRELNRLEREADDREADPARHSHRVMRETGNIGQEDDDDVRNKQNRRDVREVREVDVPDHHGQNHADADTQKMARERDIGIREGSGPHDERAESEQADPSDEHAEVHLRTEAALRGADLLVHLLQALR